MKRFLCTLIIGLFFISHRSSAQVTVNTSATASMLASKLVGSGITIISPTLSCPSGASGTFVGTTSLSFDSGIVLTNGRASTLGSAIGPFGAASAFASNNLGTSGDAQLTALSGYTTYDACILEFDFRPAGDTVRFNYVFGSEEYGCCICSSVNDVFGFFISGPGYSTSTNLAKVPGTSIPVCINSINCSSGSLCTSMGTGSPFCAYYVNNSTGTSITYYGMTTMLTATAVVAPCDTYHLKIGIADASDHILDSGVFLKAGSLNSTGIHIIPLGLNSMDTTYGSQYCVRGCTPGKFVFARPAALPTPLTLHFSIGGTASNGYDYSFIADSVTIPAYAFTDTLLINTLSVPPAGPKTIKLLLNGIYSYVCGGSSSTIDSATLTIYDSLGPISGPGHFCPGTTATLTDPRTSGTWISGSTGVVTIGSSSGIVTGVASGTATITYGFPGSCITTRVVTVDPLPSVIVGASAICVGVTTTMTDSVSGGTWSSSSPAVGSIGSTSGMLTGVSTGAITITYTLPTGCRMTKAVTVALPPGAITGTMTTCVGGTATLTGTGGGVWSSGSTGVATIGSLTGIYTGVSAGPALVTYSTGLGCNDTAIVTIVPGPTPIAGTLNVCVGSTTTLSDAVPGGIWVSGSPATASVGSSSGVVTGLFAGMATIVYSVAPATGCSVSATVTVNPAPGPISGSTSVCVGQTTILSDAGGGSWGSGAPGIATVGTYTGLVTGIAAGTAVITYTLPTGCFTTTMVTVNPAPAAITGTTSVCVATTSALSDGTPGGNWLSSDPSTAYIDPVTGVVTGIALGWATMTYTLPSGCFATTMVTVNPFPTAITGVTSVCAGVYATLYNGYSGGRWTSSNPAVATIDTFSGVYSGVMAGSAVMTYSLGAGCFVTVTVNVYPNPLPITGTAHVCPGMTTTLADATAGGVWTSLSPSIATIGSSSGVVTGVTAGTATISYSFGFGTVCATTRTVTVDPVPGPITGTGTVCPGTSVTLGVAVGSGGTWTSSATSIATIGSTTGYLTGVAAGTATITYTSAAGCFATRLITVNPNPTTILGPSSVCVGLTITATDGTPGGTWSRSNTNLTIGSTTGLITGVTAGITIITYTLATGCYATKVISINMTPGTILGSLTVCPSGLTTLSVSGGSGGIWTSGATTIATIGSASGVVTGILTGTAGITYSIGSGCMTSAIVTVNPLPALYTVSGGGSYCSGGAGLHVGLSGSVAGVTYQLYLAGSPVGTAIGGTGGVLDFGLQTGAGVYTVVATITATGCSRNMSGSATIGINPLPAVPGGPSAVCMGATVTETGGGGGTWLSSTPSIATIGSSSGIVAGIAIGTTTITYTLPTGCYITKVMTVSSAPTPIIGPGSVCAGATATLTDGVSGGTWSSATPAIGTIGSLTGNVTGILPGTTVISYSLGSGCTVTRTVTVLAAPAMITGTARVCVGASTTLADATPGGSWCPTIGMIASVGSASGVITGLSAGTMVVSYLVASTGCAATTIVTVNPVPAIITGPGSVCVGSTIIETDTLTGGTWTSGTTGIATIGSLTGIVTGMSAGAVTITYSLSGCNRTRMITVNTAPGISGPSGVCVGATITLSVSGSGSWSSGSTGIATVGSTGIVTGVSAGTAAITFTPPTGCIAIKNVTVSATPSSILGTAALCQGDTATLSNTSGGGTWSSATPAVASIGSLTGLVTSVAPGTTTITYSLGSGCTATRTLTVNALPFAITGGSALCAGATILLSDPTAGGTWSSTSTGIATVGPSTGVVSGVSIGTATIRYTLSTGCSASKTVTVTPLPSAITGIMQVCIGATTTLSNPVSGGTWSSANPVIATVGSGSGIVTGGSAGTVIISYSLGAGCTVAATVTVNPMPPGISGGTSVCAGESITLTDAAPGGTWSSGSTGTATVGSLSGVVTGVAAGLVSISYTISTGCATTYTVSVSAVPPFTGLTNLCAWGDTLTVHDPNPGGSYSSTLATVLNLGGGNGRITSFAPGTATITYTLFSGCHTTLSFTVNPLPSSMTGTMHACVGSGTALHDATPGGIWTSSTPAVATVGSTTGMVLGMSTGITYITYTLPTGCKTDTPIHVDPPPAPITIMSGTLVVGATIPFGDATPGGVWSSSNPAVASVGATTGMVTGVSAGTVIISYTVPSGCWAIKSLRIASLPGISDDGADLSAPETPAEMTNPDLRIYPNPNSGTFKIEGSMGRPEDASTDEDLWMDVTDMTGRVVYRNKIVVHAGRVDEVVSLKQEIPDGVYILGVKSGTQCAMFHLVVARGGAGNSQVTPFGVLMYNVMTLPLWLLKK